MDQILLDIHTFLLTHPHQMWKNRADDTPLRTIKTILYTLGKLKKQEVSIKLRVKEICHGFLLDYEQPLFPLRDRQGKRRSERARKSPRGKGGGGVEPLVFSVCRKDSKSRFLLAFCQN